MWQLSAILAQISHHISALQTQEKSKLSSQLEASTLGKIEGINTISSWTNNDIARISTVVSFRSGKVLNEPFLETDNAKEK